MNEASLLPIFCVEVHSLCKKYTLRFDFQVINSNQKHYTACVVGQKQCNSFLKNHSSHKLFSPKWMRLYDLTVGNLKHN